MYVNLTVFLYILWLLKNKRIRNNLVWKNAFLVIFTFSLLDLFADSFNHIACISSYRYSLVIWHVLWFLCYCYLFPTHFLSLVSLPLYFYKVENGHLKFTAIRFRLLLQYRSHFSPLLCLIWRFTRDNTTEA